MTGGISKTRDVELAAIDKTERAIFCGYASSTSAILCGRTAAAKRTTSISRGRLESGRAILCDDANSKSAIPRGRMR